MMIIFVVLVTVRLGLRFGLGEVIRVGSRLRCERRDISFTIFKDVVEVGKHWESEWRGEEEE